MRDRSSYKKGRRHESEMKAVPARPEGGVSNAVLLVFLGLLVVGFTTFAHWPVLSAKAMSFDDEEAIIRNHLVQNPSWHSAGRFFSEVFLSSVVQGYYRPLTLTSLMLDWAMGGRPDNFYPFHRTSLVLHLGSTLLVMLLCYQVFRQPVIAALVGLLFGVHPLTVEPIAWVMERKTLLAAFFAFACLCAYLRHTDCDRRRWFAAALVLFVLSLLSKPTATPLPIMMLLIDYWPLHRLNRRAVLEKIPFVALSAIFALLCCVCEQRVNPLWLPAASSPLHLPLRICYLLVFYPAKILLPIHLSSVYMLPDPLSLRNPMVVLAVAVTVVLIGALVISRRWTPALWVGATIFLVALAPTMGLVGYSWIVASDKYVYLPAVGLLLVVGRLLQELWLGGTEARRRARRVGMVAVVAVVAGLLTVGTRRYLGEWQTTDRLNRYMLAMAPHSPELHHCDGWRGLRDGHFDQAIRECTRAIELRPDFPSAYNNRGLAYGEKHDYDQAIRDYIKAIEFKPGYADAYSNCGNAYKAKGDYGRAIQDYTKAIELEPDHAFAYNNRGAVRAIQGDYDRAIRDCTRAIEFNPGYADAYNNRGNAYKARGDYGQAIQDCTKAIELAPDLVAAYNNRGIAYGRIGDYDRAIRDFTRAMELNPDGADAFYNRGVAYGKLGDYDRATQDCTKAIEIKPDWADAYSGRATTYYSLKQYDKAWADVTMCRKLGGTPDPRFVRALVEATGRSE